MTMKKQRFLSFILLVAFFFTCSCLTLTKKKQERIGTLASAVMKAPSTIKGVYPFNLPSDFSNSDFLKIIKENENPPEDDFEVLSQYQLKIIPKGSYYLLIVRDPTTGKVILFDYSCTFKVDGQVFLSPDKYDLNHLERYDPCGSAQK
jgi:hypothetical protein